MNKLILAFTVLTSAFAAQARNCAYSSKKVPICEKKVYGTLDYCREHYILHQMEMVGRVQREILNKDPSLKPCAKISEKTGKPCPHKAAKDTNLCLFCQAYNVAKAQCDVVKMNWDEKHPKKKAAGKVGKKPTAN